ncbi:MAG TPA: alkaline phosphatase family protein [Pyrinomonadaceae bacterium]|nr:alkaline phosphatase family protein [Pyrinomonadaceae bacterium]
MKNNGTNMRAGETRPRRLLLCLDGVPLEVMKAAKGRGLFDNFNAPSRLLSPFPTMTNIALATMMRASAPLGYESLYFDRKAREMRGGVGKYIGRRTPDKVPSSYMDELDYQEPLPFEYLVYVAPEMVWRADMRRFRERFSEAPRTRDYFAFLKGTDGLLHIRGRERLDVALVSLDKILRDIQASCGSETEIVVFSDHGMNLEENRRVHLQTHLRRNGYQITDKFYERASRRVALPAFGLIGFSALYCADEEAASTLADSLAELEGVDFSLFSEGKGIVCVRGERGNARIHRRLTEAGEVSYRYELLENDPLQLRGIADKLSAEGEMSEEGFASSEAWLKETHSHTYPDALENLFASLQGERVHHPADVLVSLKDGYYYGSSIFSRFVRLAATHGNAMLSSTSAFMMSTHRQLPEAIRASQAQPILRG